MAYTIWTDADGFTNAELQITVETLEQAKREKADLVKMDCGKIVVIEHASPADADLFADYVVDYPRPVRVATLWAKFCLLRVTE